MEPKKAAGARARRGETSPYRRSRFRVGRLPSCGVDRTPVGNQPERMNQIAKERVQPSSAPTWGNNSGYDFVVLLRTGNGWRGATNATRVSRFALRDV